MNKPSQNSRSPLLCTVRGALICLLAIAASAGLSTPAIAQPKSNAFVPQYTGTLKKIYATCPRATWPAKLCVDSWPFRSSSVCAPGW